MATVERLLTAEEYRLAPDTGQPTELVRGRIVSMDLPAPRHGQICARVVRLLGDYVESHDLGHVMSNDSGILTQHDPDTVRGADVAYYSYARVPRGPFPEGYLAVAPELVFEIRSPGDRWKEVLAKVVEYLDAGVIAVCVLDSGSQTARVYFEDQPEHRFTAEEELVVSEVLPDFRVPVRRFFE